MAVRIRKDRKIIVCAAKNRVEEGDLYLDDHIQYVLAVEMKVLVSLNANTENESWYFDNMINGNKKFEESLKHE